MISMPQPGGRGSSNHIKIAALSKNGLIQWPDIHHGASDNWFNLRTVRSYANDP